MGQQSDQNFSKALTKYTQNGATEGLVVIPKQPLDPFKVLVVESLDQAQITIPFLSQLGSKLTLVHLPS